MFLIIALAAVVHMLVPAMPLASAFLLAAIISPTDVIAASAITLRLNVPKRLVTVLDGESMVNDATALVAYSMAIIATEAGAFSPLVASWQLIYMSAGGIAIGWIVGLVVIWVWPRIKNIGVETALSLLAPFLAYLPAHWLGLSGVLSAVVAGLYVGRRMPVVASPISRLRLFGVWEAFVFILNALCFVLIGLQLPAVLRRLGDYSGWQLLYYALVVSVTALLLRMLWLYAASFVLGRWRRMICGEARKPSWQISFFLGWTSMRGIVSLAAALAVPTFLSDGVTPYPGRDLIVFITFGVILFTLIVQGLSLPVVIRALRLPMDDQVHAEEQTARRETAHAAVVRLEVLGITDIELTPAIARVRETYLERIRELAMTTGKLPEGMQAEADAFIGPRFTMVQRIALKAEREMLVHLRDRNMISDEVLRQIQTELDLEESRFNGQEDLPVHI